MKNRNYVAKHNPYKSKVEQSKKKYKRKEKKCELAQFIRSKR